MDGALWNIFEIAVMILEGSVLTHFIFAVHRSEYKTGRERVIYLCTSLGYAAIAAVLNHMMIYEGVLGALYIMYFFIVSVLFLDGRIVMKLFASVLGVLILLALNTIVSGAVSALFREDITIMYSQQTLSHFCLRLITQILLIFVLDIILTITDKEKITLDKKEWTLVILVLAIAFAAIAQIHAFMLNAGYSYPLNLLLAGAEGCIIAIIAACFYMTISMSRSRREAEELEMMKQQHGYQVQYAENIKSQYDEMRRIRHDMKQTYSVLGTLLSEKKYDEAEAFIRCSRKEIDLGETIIDLGDDFLNALLNSKLTEAKSKGINVFCSTAKNIGGTDPTDLCTLLGNMLDNAIEACVLCEEEKRFIEIDITSDEEQILITVSNMVAADVLKGNEDLATTKKNREDHGFGLESIRRIAKKYNGNINYHQEGSMFFFEVLLLR